MASVRQCSPRLASPLPVSVAAKTVRALIGAFVLDYWGKHGQSANSTAVSLLLDDLIYYLGEHNDPHTSGDDTMLTPPDSQISNSTMTSDYSEPFATADDDRLLGVDLREVGGHDSAIDRIERQLAGLSLAHTNHGGTKAYEVVKTRAIEIRSTTPHLAKSSQGRHTSTAVDLPTSNVELPRRRHATDLEQYIASRTATSPAAGMTSMTREMAFISSAPPKFSNDPNAENNLRKLWYGLVSPHAVVYIKHTLKLSAPVSTGNSIDCARPNQDPKYHFNKIKQYQNAQETTLLKRLYHLRQLYVSVRGKERAGHDEGFIAYQPPSKRPKGNPRNQVVKQSKERMIAVLAPDIEYDTIEDQDRQRKMIDGLNDTGRRLDMFARELGDGVLCLLCHHLSSEPVSKMLNITDHQSVLLARNTRCTPPP